MSADLNCNILKKSKKSIKYYMNNTYNCKKKFKDTYNNIKRIIVIGDIHGDLKILLKCLRLANLIDADNNWCGKDTHVVQLGDIVDKGGRGIMDKTIYMEEFVIYEYLNLLDIQARKNKGAVHYLLGNHELMNILGDFRYVHPNHLSDTGFSKRKKLFSPRGDPHPISNGGYMAKLLGCHAYGILKINKWYFVHAGLLPSHVNDRSITEINKLVRNILNGKIKIDDISTREEELLFSKDSFFWTRFYANNKNACKVLNNTLDLLGNKNGGLIVGHTPNYTITDKCRKKLWFADVGLSGAFGNDYFNKVQVLEIKNNKPKILS